MATVETSVEAIAAAEEVEPEIEEAEETPEAIGVRYEEGEPLRAGRKEEERDEHRWELDPASSEDYVERTRTTVPEAEPVRAMRHVDRYAGRTGER